LSRFVEKLARIATFVDISRRSIQIGSPCVRARIATWSFTDRWKTRFGKSSRACVYCYLVSQERLTNIKVLVRLYCYGKLPDVGTIRLRSTRAYVYCYPKFPPEGKLPHVGNWEVLACVYCYVVHKYALIFEH